MPHIKSFKVLIARVCCPLIIACCIVGVPVLAIAQAAPAPAANVPPPPGYPARGDVPLPPGYSATAPAVAATATAASRPAARGRGGLGAALPGPRAIAAPGEGPSCSLDATVYESRLPSEQIGRLDIDALTRAAATPAAFEKALADFGTMKPLYRVNQSVRLAGDYIQVGGQVPYIIHSQPTTNGIVNTVAYASVGAIFDMMGKSSSDGKIEVDMAIQISSLSEGTTTVSATVKAPIFRIAQVSHKGPVVPRQPFVVVSVDASSVDADGKAIAYIARVTLGEPQAAAAPASRP